MYWYEVDLNRGMVEGGTETRKGWNEEQRGTQKSDGKDHGERK